MPGYNPFTPWMRGSDDQASKTSTANSTPSNNNNNPNEPIQQSSTTTGSNTTMSGGGSSKAPMRIELSRIGGKNRVGHNPVSTMAKRDIQQYMNNGIGGDYSSLIG